MDITIENGLIRNSLAAAVFALVVMSTGCADDDDVQHCDACDLTDIEASFEVCVAGCEPDCTVLDETECDAAMDRCRDECDGCAEGLECARRGDGAFRCFQRDDPFDLCIDVL